MRGVRKALGWRYVFGMTVSRGAMAAWLIWYQKGDWVFLWESDDADITWGWILLGWLWFQVSILLAQEIFGPRFFISGNVFLIFVSIVLTDSYFLPRIIISRPIWMTKKRNLWMGNVMIVRFVCNQLSFLHYLHPEVGVILLH